MEEDPRPDDLFSARICPTPVAEENGAPGKQQATVMVDSALFAVRRTDDKPPGVFALWARCGARLECVSRQHMAQQFGDHRGIYTPIRSFIVVAQQWRRRSGT